MQKRQRRRVPRQKAARDDAEKDEFVVEIKVGWDENDYVDEKFSLRNSH